MSPHSHMESLPPLPARWFTSGIWQEVKHGYEQSRQACLLEQKRPVFCCFFKIQMYSGLFLGDSSHSRGGATLNRQIRLGPRRINSVRSVAGCSKVSVLKWNAAYGRFSHLSVKEVRLGADNCKKRGCLWNSGAARPAIDLSPVRWWNGEMENTLSHLRIAAAHFPAAPAETQPAYLCL